MGSEAPSGTGLTVGTPVLIRKPGTALSGVVGLPASKQAPIRAIDPVKQANLARLGVDIRLGSECMMVEAKGGYGFSGSE